MSIQEEKAAEPNAEADKVNAEGEGGDAEFESGWDDLKAKEEGQPSEAEGRQDADADDDQTDEDEAGQGADKDATPSADAGKASRGETSDDLGDDPAKLKAALAAEREAKVKAENTARSHGGRLAQTLNELNDLKKNLESEKKKGATPEGEEADDEDERIKQLRADYPEVAEPLLEKIAALEATVKGIEGAKETDQTAGTEAQIQALYTEQLETLKSRHDDFGTVVQSPEYRTWLQDEKTPAWARRVIQENTPHIVSAAECAEVLDLFKQKAGWGKAKQDADESVANKRKRQLDAGTAVSGRQPAVTHDEDGSFEDEWDRLSVKEQRKRAAGFR